MKVVTFSCSADDQGGKLSLDVTLLNLAIYDVIAVIVKVSIFSWCAAGCQTLELRLEHLKNNILN